MGLFDIFSTQAAEDARDAKKRGLEAGDLRAQGYLTGGLNLAEGYFDKAAAPFDALIGKSMTGYDAYADATGAGGLPGLERARTSFDASPWARLGIDTALSENDRRAASRGMLASGNTIADTTKLASDLSAKNYGSFVTGLSPFASQPGQLVGQRANILTDFGKLGTGVSGQQAQYAYGTETGKGTADAEAEMAKYDVSKNMWGLGLNAAKLATGFMF